MDRGKKRSRGRRRGFVQTLYEVVNDVSTDSTISWSESGKSFVVWNESEFIRDFLPRYFLRPDLEAFIVRLLTYGFTKVVVEESSSSSERWEYAHPCFLRGKPELTAANSFVVTSSPELLRMRMRELQKQRILAIKRIQERRRHQPVVAHI
ncbi:PREDICTED: heat stress transcription factor B-2a-like [Camelina sativa]|uniref:Heat stress transcription factor B-2a-like n=1 Tax=Camelina sativa TaxID=90675 RepID=A0ABM0WW70_CAMSA|nr:PREDICTED: heat stress transcription factor B-2a-like [Camelina sativa]